MVSQFQGMVLEEKSPANRPSFADVRRRNNEVSLNRQFAEPENLDGSHEEHQLPWYKADLGFQPTVYRHVSWHTKTIFWYKVYRRDCFRYDALWKIVEPEG